MSHISWLIKRGHQNSSGLHNKKIEQQVKCSEEKIEYVIQVMLLNVKIEMRQNKIIILCFGKTMRAIYKDLFLQLKIKTLY